MKAVEERNATDERHPIEELAEEFIERLRRGERPSISEFAARRPESENEIRELFGTLLLMERVDARHQASPVCRQAGGARSAMPERLGEYRIVRELGRGGMGIVYEAVQERLGRRVALKALPTPAWFDGTGIARFEREAQAAGQLQHAHIVPVYDFGEADGVYYYTMQYVEGRGLDEVIRQMRREDATVSGARVEDAAGALDEGSPAASDPAWQLLLLGGSSADGARDSASASAANGAAPRGGGSSSGPSHVRYAQSVARLGVDLAEALAYAHAQGVVHRDIKPSNVLLDRQGKTWIADFGLAKTENCDEITGDADMIGTLRYMAPEQLRGWADPRTDVHGLGLVLYELLTLRPAFVDRDRARLMDRIAHEMPPRISAAAPATPRDLETIVFKAIANEPRDRYATAGEMADDLRSFLDGRPIVARRTSRRERFWLWCRRNRLVATLGATVAALVVAVASVVTVAAIRLGVERNEALAARNSADEEAGHARRAAEQADRINQFLENMLRSADPALTRSQEVTVRDVLDRAAETIDSELADEPALAAALHDTVGWTYARLGVYESAERHLRQALETRRTRDDVPALDLATTLDHLAHVLVDRHWPAREPAHQALALCREAGDIRERELGDDNPLTIASRGLRTRIEEITGSSEHAEQSFAAIGEALDPHLFNPERYERTMTAVRELWKSGRREEAARLIRETTAPLREKLGSDKMLIDSLMWFAARQSDAGDYAVSEALYRATIEQCRATHQGDHPDTALALARLSHLLAKAGTDDAESTCREALAMFQRLYHGPHADAGWVLNDLGNVLSARGRHKEAAAEFRRAIEARRAVLGDNHELAAYSVERLARALELSSGSRTEILALRREAWRIRRKAHGENDPRAAVAERQLALALAGLPQSVDEAEGHFRHAVELLRATAGDRDTQTALACNDLAWFAFEQRGNYGEAASLAREALRIRERVHGDDHRMVWNARRRLAYLLAAPTNASGEHVREAADLAERAVRHVEDEYAWQTLAIARLREGQWQAAAEAVRRGDALAKSRSSVNRLILALALWRLNEPSTAQAEFDKVVAQYGRRKPDRIRSILIDKFRTLAGASAPILAPEP